MDLVVNLMAACNPHTLLLVGIRTNDGLMSSYGYYIDIDKKTLRGEAGSFDAKSVFYGMRN